MQNVERRRKSRVNAKINVVIVLLVLILAIMAYWSYKFYGQKNIINAKYEKEDIETIEEVRDFFLFYFEAQEYGIYVSTMEIYRFSYIVDNASRLLRKYGELKLDQDKKLTYDEQQRHIQIVQESFVFDTGFNVDIPSYRYIYWQIEVPTEYGTWAKIDSGIPKYVLYLFGNEMDTIEFDGVPFTLHMRDVNKFNVLTSYKVDTKYYLFSDGYDDSYLDYYIYVVDENEWIKFPSIKDIGLQGKFISFIDSDNNFSVYCVEHNSEIFVGNIGEDETLSFTTDPTFLFVPDSVDNNEQLKNQLFISHERCD